MGVETVTELDPSSVAAAAGIQEGDMIQEVNRKPVRNVERFRDAVWMVPSQYSQCWASASSAENRAARRKGLACDLPLP
jgi:S1-C subfamily serine protease